jgi:hypothetical protein
MKKSTLYLLLAAIVLAGCFYKAPISFTASRQIDRSAIGTWQIAEEPESKLIISEADRTHYALSVRPPKDGPLYVGPAEFRAHHTKVGEMDIVNVQVVDPRTGKSGDWAFFGYIRPDKDTLRIRPVSDAVVPPHPSVLPGYVGGELLTTPEAMKRHFESVINRPDLFASKEIVYHRVPRLSQ